MPRKPKKAPEENKPPNKRDVKVTVEPSFTGLSSPKTGKAYGEIIKYFNSTGTILGGTVTNAYRSIDKLEDNLLLTDLTQPG